MPPLLQLSKGPAGKLESKQLEGTASVQVCVECNKRRLVDAYFEDIKTHRRFYALHLGDVVSVEIGLSGGEAWYHWIWMWESKEEADEAWRQVPAGQTGCIDQLLQLIDDFVRGAQTSAKPKTSRSVLDITPNLAGIGWEVTILEYTQEEIARRYKSHKSNKEARQAESSERPKPV